MDRVLVTGGAGFIGSHLCQHLVSQNIRVICADNLLTGKLENINGLAGKDSFLFLKWDITQPIQFSEPLDGIFHLACPASPVDYLNYPIQTLEAGGIGTHQVLRLAEEKKARVLLASTSEVYGDPQVHPQPESYWGNVNPVGPRSVYDEAKRFAEAMVMAFHRAHGLDTRIVRIFNTYGPRMRKGDGRVVPNFILQALSGNEITIYGQGKQTRSFCYVDDLVAGLLAAFDRGDSHPINLGNDREVSIRELAQKIIGLTQSSSRLGYRAMPEDDPRIRRPDISRAKSLLGWEPKVSLENGLKRTIEFFKNMEKES